MSVVYKIKLIGWINNIQVKITYFDKRMHLHSVHSLKPCKCNLQFPICVYDAIFRLIHPFATGNS